MLATGTGFLFPFAGFLASHGIGVISALALTTAALGWMRSRTAFPGRLTRVAIVTATYLLVFVAIA